MPPTDLQLQTLRLYAELLARDGSWASKLIFTAGADSSATGLPAAVSIAGGTTLILDPDAATVKSVFRSGGLDFIVNTLDEALRVLKNELRKHTPLSVALIADPAAVLAEMADRGVQPDLAIHIGPTGPAPTLALETLTLTLSDGVVQPSFAAAQWLTARNWSEHTLPAATTAALRTLDVRLIQLLPPNETPRLEWLRRIPHYQRPGPNASRTTWLTPTEAGTLEVEPTTPNP